MNDKIRSFTDLHAWQEGHQLVLSVYIITKQFPVDEKYGLIDQLRRCSISITSNIAEGFSRKGKKEKTQFLYMALGSTTELQNQILVARDVGHIDNTTFQALAKQTVIVNKLINGLIKSAKILPS